MPAGSIRYCTLAFFGSGFEVKFDPFGVPDFLLVKLSSPFDHFSLFLVRNIVDLDNVLGELVRVAILVFEIAGSLMSIGMAGIAKVPFEVD